MQPRQTRRARAARRWSLKLPQIPQRLTLPTQPQLRLWLKWGAAAIVIGLVADILYALLTLPPLPAGGFDPTQASMVYASDGTEIGPLSGDLFRISVDLAKAPEYLGEAYVASEDRRFYEHHGVDPRGIVRAVLTNLQAGEIHEGASTITQQVVRMAFLTTKQTLNRKIQEAVLALALESRSEKDEILNMYLNQIYLGNGAYGVGAGAKLYFNKDVADLTLGEAAMLAGITPAPESYNPLRRPDVAERQRNIILDRMVVAGYLTQEEAEAEKAEPLQIRQGRAEVQQQYPWYMDAVREELKSRYDLDERVVDLMGLKIYTGLDPAMQATAEETLAARIFPAEAPDGLQGAFVALDPRSGEVRAVVGGRTYEITGGLNRATDGRLSPGSAFKPVMVYAPAFEYAGLTPDSIVSDKPLNLDGWEPQNWDNQFRGDVTVREAARLSLNSPAVQMLQQVGVKKAKGMAEKLGITFAKGEDSLTLALGAMEEGISPLQLAAAYQAFANGGYYVEPHLITRVEAADGILDPGDVERRRAMSSNTAFLVTDMLKTVVQSGTATGAKIGRTMAGKTGTVELPPVPEFEGLEGNSAAWFVGYTPDVVGAVWLGYDQTDSEHYLPPSITGATYPPTIWRRVVGTALAGSPALEFPGPDGRAPQAVAKPPVKPEPEPTPEPEPVTLQPVTGLTATKGKGPGEAVLSWQGKLPEGTAGRVAFQVIRGTTADVPVDAAHTLTIVAEPTYVDHPPAGGTYYYKVATVDMTTKKVGTPSNVVSVVVPGTGTGTTPGTGTGTTPGTGTGTTPGTGTGTTPGTGTGTTPGTGTGTTPGTGTGTTPGTGTGTTPGTGDSGASDTTRG